MRKILFVLAIQALSAANVQAVTFHDLQAGDTNAACEIPVWQGGSGGGAYKIDCTAFFASLPGISSASAFRTAIGAVTGAASSTNGNIATFSGTTGKLVQDSGKALPSGAVLGTSDTQTVTNKTVSGANNTVSGPFTGTTTNDNAAAGKIGEFVSSNVTSGSAVSLTTTTPANITSISLSAGDWDVNGIVVVDAGAGASTFALGWISSTSATVPSFPSAGMVDFPSGGLATQFAMSTGSVRFTFATTTTVYLSARSTFASGSDFGLWVYSCPAHALKYANLR